MKQNNLIAYHQNIIRCNSGLNFALICGICWGIAYILIENIMGKYKSNNIMPIVLSASTSIIITVVNIIWISTQEKLKEFLLTLKSPSLFTKLFIASILGSISTFCTYIIATSNTVFSTIAVLFYPALTAVIAHKYYKEIIGRQCVLGIFIILGSNILIYLPNFYAGDKNTLLLSVLGILAGVGWGIEGAIIGKLCEVADSDVCLTIRFCIESIVWVAVCAYIIFLDIPIFTFKKILFKESLLIIIAISLFLAINYINWYRSIVYIGASRGAAVSNISGFILLVLNMLFYKNIPDWYMTISASALLVGVIIIYYDCVNSDGFPILRKKGYITFSNYKSLSTTKFAILSHLAKSKKLWDYEIANYIQVKEHNYSSRYRDVIRNWTIELRAMGLIEVVEEAIDNGEHFQRGKRLCQYQIAKK